MRSWRHGRGGGANKEVGGGRNWGVKGGGVIAWFCFGPNLGRILLFV